MLSYVYLRSHTLSTMIQARSCLNEHAGAPSSSSPLAFQTSVDARNIFSVQSLATEQSLCQAL
jgi:hypothetical protein